MSERRTGWLLIAVLVGLLLLITAQLPAAGGEATRLEAAVLFLVAVPARLTATVVEPLEDLGEGLRSYGELRRENALLKAENQRLERRLQRFRSLEGQMRNLAGAVDFEPPSAGRLQLAEVVYLDPSSWVRTLVLYAPGLGAAEDQPVLVGGGLVGRVVLVSGSFAKVQLITDRSASVGGMVERTRRQGLVRGSAEGGLELAYQPHQADLSPGDRVVTSGIDGVYPRGISIGQVVSVTPEDDLFQKVDLRPSVDFSSLDHAYILRGTGVPRAVVEALPGDP